MLRATSRQQGQGLARWPSTLAPSMRLTMVILRTVIVGGVGQQWLPSAQCYCWQAALDPVDGPCRCLPT